MNEIYVIGHRNPDTDSICSVIAYAELLNSKGNGTYIPARCGPVTEETGYALDYFGIEEPRYIESVEASISDLPQIYSISAEESVPTIDIVKIMDENNVRNVPITDSEGFLKGLISEYGLAQAYVRRDKIEQLSITPIKLDTLKRILHAEILVPSCDLLEGRVYIAIDALHVTLSKLTKNDVAIVGDNEPAQLALIAAGIAALILADGAPAGERVRKAAEAKGVAVLSTKLDAFGVGKMINLSLPASQIMATDVPTVSMEDSTDYAKQLVSNSRYRTACVTGKDGKYQGMISRNTFLDDISKNVILLDHNEFGQAVEGIEKAEILEIIDHHRIGTISTLKPICFINEPVGSTCTIIASRYLRSKTEISRGIAGILLSGILSDTMVLRLSTTTDRDREIVDRLSKIAGVDPIEYGTELIKRGMNLEGEDLETLLMRDTKSYELYGKKIIISQIMVPTFEFSHENSQEIISTSKKIKKSSGVDIFAVLLTSVFENSSELYLVADEIVLSNTGAEKQPLLLEGMMSRKNDFIPWFGHILKNL
ncbi:Inorganic diphosphatase [Methanolacinia petrolearia DSM 11571]|uniref:inorganic diphosphatase n=1 Tax=Methanolacinia petrolearia (strain DSM 11571 / OCM 486 / SEBR 4847) TaxID=679926 RepID=E1RG23_METP4|nr:putative manganese-dependent inorganic diphosphatase [Methanolacinia petrolearia]ADN36258.1 Inorganic diphosphatase [Methanolacinia petrolearia DSM 11571]